MDLASSILEYHNNVSYSQLSQKAYNILLEFIIFLVLLPGSFHKEADICDAIKIGRTPIREAFKRLEFVNFVSVLPRFGIQISELNFEDYSLCREVRCSIEDIAIRKTAFSALPHERKIMSSIRDRYNTAFEQRNICNIIRADRDFHNYVSECSHNKFIGNALLPFTLYDCRLFYLRYHSPDNQGEEFEYVNRMHIDMMQSIIDGDADKAASLLRNFDYKSLS